MTCSIKQRPNPKVHHPHPIIARHQIPINPYSCVQKKQHHNLKAKPANKPNLSVIGIPSPIKQRNIKICNPDINGWTIQKEKPEDARHSEETASNRNSSNLEGK